MLHNSKYTLYNLVVPGFMRRTLPQNPDVKYQKFPTVAIIILLMHDFEAAHDEQEIKYQCWKDSRYHETDSGQQFRITLDLLSKKDPSFASSNLEIFLGQ